MQSENSKVYYRLAETPPGQTLDVLGATIELSWSDDFCVMRGVIPAGGIVPLHRHGDAEDFLVLSGAQQVPATPKDVTHFVEVSAKYGYVLGTPEENAAVGIETPQFAG